MITWVVNLKDELYLSRPVFTSIPPLTDSDLEEFKIKRR